jgi:plasmid stability protein
MEDQAMATLNIMNLPDALYEKLKARARYERQSVAQELTCLLSAALDTPPSLSIMELQGWAWNSGKAWTPRLMSMRNERHGTDRRPPP